MGLISRVALEALVSCSLEKEETQHGRSTDKLKIKGSLWKCQVKPIFAQLVAFKATTGQPCWGRERRGCSQGHVPVTPSSPEQQVLIKDLRF